MRETFDLELVQYFWIIFFTSLQLHCKAPKGTGHEGVGLPATQSPKKPCGLKIIGMLNYLFPRDRVWLCHSHGHFEFEFLLHQFPEWQVRIRGMNHDNQLRFCSCCFNVTRFLK